MPQKILAEWTYNEFENPPRKKSWYTWTIIIFVFLMLYSIFTANFLFGLIIIIAAIIFFIYYHKEPVKIQVSITSKGIILNNRLFDFKELKQFWLVYEPPEVKNLYLEFKATLKPTIVIPLDKENPVKIKKILKEYLKENLDKEGEGTIEALERILKI